MSAPKLWQDLFAGEGTVGFPPEWLQLDPLLRADLLKDWLIELEKQYDAAVAEMAAEHAAKQGALQ